MATIDPNIALGVKPIQIENPMNRYAAMSQIQSNEQANQLNALKMQEAQQEMADRNALRTIPGGINDPDYIANVAKINPKLAIALQKDISAHVKSGFESTELQNRISKQETDKNNAMLRDLSANPSDANITAYYEEAQMKHANNPQNLAKAKSTYDYLMSSNIPTRIAFLSKQGATPSELKPTILSTNLGGSELTRQIDPFSGASTTISNLKKTPTPGDLMVDARSRDRLAQDMKALTPQETAALSQAIVEGRLDPNRVNSRNSKMLAATLLTNPTANLVNLGAIATGANAESRTLGTINANVASAATEAGSMIDLVNEYSSKVDRTRYPTLNAIQNAVDKGTGGEDIVKLNASINSLVNSYARAINPKGVATVEAKKHARELLNSAFTNGQILATTAVMNQEIDLALAAPMKAQKSLTQGRGGTGVDSNSSNSTTKATSNTVTTSDGKVYTFPTPEAAAKFKQAAGIK